MSFFPGRVPWPSGMSSAPLNPTEAMLQQWAARGPSLPCIRLAWVLSSLTPQEGAARLVLAAQACQRLLVADFRAAERNLDWPAVLTAQLLTRGRIVRFLVLGGLEGCAYGAGLRVIRRRTFFLGAGLLLTLERGVS